jgi:hypothetical protein
MAEGDTPESTPQGGLRKNYDQDMTDVTRSFMRGDAKVNALDGVISGRQELESKFGGDSDVAAAIRELIAVIMNLQKPGDAAAAAPAVGQAAKDGIDSAAGQQPQPAWMKKLFDDKGQVNFNGIDDLTPDEAEQIFDSQAWDSLGFTAKKKIGGVRSKRRKGTAEGDRFTFDEMPDVHDFAETTDATRAAVEEPWKFGLPPSFPDFSIATPEMQGAIGGTDQHQALLAKYEQFAEAERAFRDRLISILTKIVHDLRVDYDRLEHIERYFLQQRTTL